MQAETPSDQHRWLSRLVGNWKWEFEMAMTPGEPPSKHSGTETVRSVGELWVVGEGRGQMPDGTPSTTILTLGYDPNKQQFVGSWLGSMMTYFWVYEGSLEQNVLTLRTTGPNCTDPGKTAQYREVIELKSDDLRKFASSVLGDDGQWQQMMSIEYHRVK